MSGCCSSTSSYDRSRSSGVVNGDLPANHDDSGKDEAERHHSDVKEWRIFKQGRQEDCCHSAEATSDIPTSQNPLLLLW